MAALCEVGGKAAADITAFSCNYINPFDRKLNNAWSTDYGAAPGTVVNIEAGEKNRPGRSRHYAPAGEGPLRREPVRLVGRSFVIAAI